MSKVITLTATNGETIQFVDEIKAQGGMKDVMFSPNKDYVVAFFREPADLATKERLEMITCTYREKIFNQEGGEYLKKLFCWPTAVVEYQGKLGVVSPFYRDCFFFQYGSCNNDMLGIKGKDKDGKWFASASNRNKFLDSRELGDWMLHLKVCLMLARAVRRMHMAGLSHSDLGYKNCLIDPTTGQASLIDIDGLVVPGKHPPTVVGTPDFIAPEVVATQHLDKSDPKRKLPSRTTDLHALAVLIYMYLLYRHPLRGDKVFDMNDSQRDEELGMGEKALFIEHPTDHSNRIKLGNVKPSEQPWKDTQKMPYTITGPYLSELFKRAFIDGLHNPIARPTADEWEQALVKTVDLLQPCQGANCEQKWYAFDNSKSPKCPFCGTAHQGKLPVLNLYSAAPNGSYRPDNHRIMVYSGQSLFKWHADNRIFPNEKLKGEDAKRIGYFVLHQGNWWLVNENLTDMVDVNTKQSIPIGGKVKLEEGAKILLKKGEGGRLIVVQMTGS
ncbi:helix-hairpin-helix domain-containing protein [Haemophilus sp.]|jgi:non-specific serine/threonine protein kinase|nr:kinase [Haemophilus sp.]MBF1240143.1 kinase [Haemophilus sp.]MDQ6566791.1 kinase [Haemophilus parainfluenzae]MDU6937741.1 kinase [Haemophilus parainfluenzae]